MINGKEKGRKNFNPSKLVDLKNIKLKTHAHFVDITGNGDVPQSLRLKLNFQTLSPTTVLSHYFLSKKPSGKLASSH